MHQIVFIIPVYNEASNLSALFDAIEHTHIKADIVVINDGSTDASRDICHKRGVTCIDHPSNRGIHHALLTGITYAYTKGYSIVVKLDADLQHQPSDISTLLRSLITSGADVVIGSRFIVPSGYVLPAERSYAIACIRWLLWYLGCSIHDPTSGFWVMNKKVIRHLAQYQRPLFESAMLLSISVATYVVREVSITMKPRFSGTSKISLLKGSMIMMSIVFQVLRIKLEALFATPRKHTTAEMPTSLR